MANPGRPVALGALPSVTEFLATTTRSAGDSQQVAAVKYAKSVREFANLPDGRGANHAPLANFLGKLSSRWPTSWELPHCEQRFALSYSFDVSNATQNITKQRISEAVEYMSCADFVTKTNSETLKSSGRLLFLRGYPSVEWLGLLGGAYGIDPEFFVRFLHFKPAKFNSMNHSLPVLPASTWNILELPIITIGERSVLSELVNQDEIDSMRKEARSRLKEHHNLLRAHDKLGVTSSVVRDVAVIDQSCFALEQRIWICLQPQRTRDGQQSRWTLIVWSDSGLTPSVKSILDLNVLPSKFQTDATSLAPVIDYKPGTGLAAQKFTSHGHVHSVRGAEASSQLCIGYGRTLYEDIMATDPLYALTEVFNLTTASVNQYLNLLEHYLIGFTDDEHYDNFDMLSNLRYSKDILYRQQRQLEQVSAWLRIHKLRGGTGWRTSSEEDPKASQAMDCIVERYDYLLTRVKTLQAQCQDAISNLMNNINLKEVKSSYEQSKRIAKLTLLAFVFAPLSFTTSFFGMDIGLKNLNIKTWIIMTLVTVSITTFLMLCDIVGWIKKLHSRFKDLTRKARYI